jgi:hypothetical protein
MTIPGVLGVIAFVVAMGHAAFALLRWAREPTFEVLDATFAMEERQGVGSLRGGRVTVLAVGGGRTRNIVDWKLLLGPTGAGYRAGVNLVVEPIMQTIPAHDAVKFSVEVGAGSAIDEDVRSLAARLYLRLGRDWEEVRFLVTRGASGDFSLDSWITHTPYSLHLPPWWKRAARRFLRRFS